jgi:hypothetical protein
MPYAMKANGGSGCIDLLFLDLNTSFTPRPLFPLGKEPPVSVGYEAGWAPKPLKVKKR